MIAVALPMRSGWPARHPSPKKSPGPSMATTASLPVFDSTDSLTPPDWMYRTSSQASPCVKMASPRPYFDDGLRDSRRIEKRLCVEVGECRCRRRPWLRRLYGDTVAALVSMH